MTYNGKKVLVTGAGGFIGSHLVEALVQQGADVTAFVHYNSRNHWGNLEHLSNTDGFSTISGNIEDNTFVKKAVLEKDIIFHLAALIGIPYSYTAPGSYINTNIIGTYNILQSALDSGVEKVVHTSTSEVYGTAEYVPIDEKHPLKGQSPYSATKIGADKLVESFFYSYNLPVATIRPFNTYGPRQSARAVIPAIITQALIKKEVYLGSLTPIRDLTYVKDTVDAFLKIGAKPSSKGKTMNVGSGKGITIGDLAQLIIEIIDPEIPVISQEARIRPDHSEVRELICDFALAKYYTGWEPCIPLETGIRYTLDWIRKNIENYKADAYII